MRIAFIGAGDVSVETAKALINNNHSVIMLEINKQRIDDLADELDCSFLLGDGTRPHILRELNPSDTDILFCLTNNDQVNILASMVADSLGFKKVITSIADAEFESVCRELGIENVIIPVRTISRYLQDIVSGSETVEMSAVLKDDDQIFSLEMSTVLKDDARFFTFTAPANTSVQALNLPDGARAVCFYRDEKFSLATDETELVEGDEVVILTHSRNLALLKKHWQS